jgi:hypothetical protein
VLGAVADDEATALRTTPADVGVSPTTGAIAVDRWRYGRQLATSARVDGETAAGDDGYGCGALMIDV